MARVFERLYFGWLRKMGVRRPGICGNSDSVKKSKRPPRCAQRMASRAPISRMSTIHKLLNNKKRLNRRMLAELLEVSQKTVQRDIDFMRDMLNLPIRYDAKKHSYHYAMPVNNFDPFQLLFLQTEQWERDFVSNGRIFGKAYLSVLRKINDAILNSHEIHFNYFKDRFEPKKVRPFHLVYVESAWCVIGVDMDSGDPEAFALYRISDLAAHCPLYKPRGCRHEMKERRRPSGR